ncbi:MAG: septal ring lytic transglycosylase RlpA family protein [Sphingopyxis sp.]|uniref:septal ring lytic transglycosylase RlpA family protein n=1 Tax=Sphingopyxis sp. TaxID=1908224 RepID=UPI003D80BE62
MKSIVRGGGLMAGAALLLGGCGSFDGKRENGPAAGPVPASAAVDADGPVKIGAPYTIGTTTYTPVDVRDYDEVGYASWYGDELAGRPTANGETFDPAAITAAHKTLPLPSYVEVTALDTGRTILVRVNDRGPMANDRLIDLSRAAAEQLGLKAGVAGVRVRRTNPPMSERAQLRAGGAVPARIATPGSLLTILRDKLKALPVPAGVVAGATAASAPTPTPATGGAAVPTSGDRFIVEGSGATAPVRTATPKPAAAPAAPKPAPAAATANAGGYVVQVAAFSGEARANAAAKSVGGTVVRTGSLWRVRIGPFASDSDAQAALGKARAKGFRDALVQRDR